MAKMHSFSALCPLALSLLLIPSAADGQQQPATPQEHAGQPRPPADQPPQQPYQLQEPSSAPKRRAPRLGGPITALCMGGLMLFGAVYVATLDLDEESGGLQVGLGASLGGTALLSLAVGGAVLARRMGQRTRYGFAPIIHPQRSLYGLQGMVSF